MPRTRKADLSSDERMHPENISHSEGVYLYDWSTIPGHKGKRWQVRVLDEKKKRLEGGSPMKSKRFNDRNKAEEWAKDKKAKLWVGQDQSGRVPAGVLLDEYLETLDNGTAGQRHKQTVRYVLKRAVEEAHMSDLLDPDVARRAQSWLNGLTEGKKRLDASKAPLVSVSTKRSHGGRLIAWGEWLVKQEHVTRNPFRRLTLPKKRDENVREPFTVAECRLLVSDQGLATEFGLYFATLLYGGFRRVEGAWLRREHVRPQNSAIIVRDADDADEEEAAIIHSHRTKVNYGRVPKLRYVKTLKGKPRMARLEQELAPLLQPLLVGDPRGYVFPRSLRTVSDADWTGHLDALCKAVGVDRRARTVHCLRHTNACLLDACGVGGATLRAHLGHADSSMTDNYTHHIAVMRLDCETWDRRICLRGNDARPDGCTPLHDSPPGNGRATGPAPEEPTKAIRARAESFAESDPIVITDGVESTRISLAEPSRTQTKDPVWLSDSPPDSRPGPAMSWEYRRQEHTECITHGGVMSFRMVAPLLWRDR